MRLGVLGRGNVHRGQASPRRCRAWRDGEARARHQNGRSVGSIRRPRGSFWPGPSAERGRGGRRGGHGSARSRPTASARARGSIPLARRNSGSPAHRRCWRLGAFLHRRRPAGRHAELASRALGAVRDRLGGFVLVARQVRLPASSVHFCRIPLRPASTRMNTGIARNGPQRPETAYTACFSFASRRSPVRSRYAPTRHGETLGLPVSPFLSIGRELDR
jgi:hypothetical protein